MSAVSPKDRQRPFPGSERPRRFQHLEARQMFEPGASTLDERISSAWSGLVSAGTAECPVCASGIHAAKPCAGCGSELS
ncbi:MAG: hypothetical protein QOI31_477 [Solirubrobacterales bacterium]|nr:hypothetical protein [Solirubrobacterales bacterium]